MTWEPSLGACGIVMLSSCEVRVYSEACTNAVSFWEHLCGMAVLASLLTMSVSRLPKCAVELKRCLSRICWSDANVTLQL